MAFFRKADAKVRLIFELPKLFRRNFQKSFFWSGSSCFRPFVQHFNSTAFLSRKRMQNYCFTTYLTNVSAYFFALFCNLFANSLICSTVDDWRFWAGFEGRFILHLNIITRTRIFIYIKHASRTLHPIHPPMKRTVSSFTTEHLQQSLQHCNESISYDGSTDYGGRSSATGNGHLPQYRDRCGRWVSAHLQQECTDFHVYGLPLQMCMWFYMTRQKHKQQWCVGWIGWRGEKQTFMYIEKRNISYNHPIHPFSKTPFHSLDEQTNASREILQRLKAHSRIRQRVFKKTSKTFSKSSSSL